MNKRERRTLYHTALRQDANKNKRIKDLRAEVARLKKRNALLGLKLQQLRGEDV